MAIKRKSNNTPSEPTKAKLVNQIAEKSISRVRQDVASWNMALTMAKKAEKPKRHLLYNLYNEISIDGLLQSQINNRFLKSLASNFIISDKNGIVNDEVTAMLQDKIFVNEINKAILETITHGHSVVEFDTTLEPENRDLKCTLIKRQNIEPKEGLFYPDHTEDKFVKYREMKEYGTFILEFGNFEDLGLLNSAVPHVLFKRFAQSCWSELCEIAGIPPRVMKTDTQNMTMLRRAERMMKEMGAAAWFIIDESEKFEWAQSSNATGEVYENLLIFCNNEISMLVSGAVMGQDTANGSNSKETAMQETLQTLVDSDLSLLEQYWNNNVMKALVNIGIIPSDLVFSYPKTKNIKQLWQMTNEAIGKGYDMDLDWANKTFGFKLTGLRQQQAKPTTPVEQNFDADFYGLNADYFGALHNRLNFIYDCGCESNSDNEIITFALGTTIKNLYDTAEKALKKLYQKKGYKPSDLKTTIEYQNLIFELNTVFEKGVTDNVVEGKLLENLRNDVFYFSALKTHAQLFEASRLLLNSEGKIKPFAEFFQDIKKINLAYNRQYLEAEYKFAVGSAQMADKWSNFSDSEDYYLQYRTAGDEKVRPTHRALRDITLPKSDTFWDSYYPPNGWGICRCTVLQVLADDYKKSNSKEAIKLGEVATTQIGKDGKNRLEIFRFNPGKQKVIFPPSHPYSKVEGAKEVITQIKK